MPRRPVHSLSSCSIPGRDSTSVAYRKVAAVLRPGTGSLWKFYDDALAAVLPKQGTQFTPNPSGGVKLTPGFVTFMNCAARLPTSAPRDDSQQPHLSFSVQPMPGDPFSSVTISLNGEVIRSTAGGNLESARIDWIRYPREAKLAAGNGGPDLTMVGPFNGAWALFQLFNAADDWKQNGNGYRVGWELSTRAQRVALPNGGAAKIAVQLDGAAAAPVLRKGFFSGAECSGEIAR